MRHASVAVKSGKYKLQKMTLAQVKKAIRETGGFHGFMCGNKVNPRVIAEGWHLGVEIEITDNESLAAEADKMTTGLQVYTPELGTFPHFYKIVEITENTKGLI